MSDTRYSDETRRLLAELARWEDYQDEVWPPEQRDADQAQWLFEWSQARRP